MKYFTFIGNHDRIDNSRSEFGAVLSIFLQYRAEVDDVYLFVSTPRRDEPVNYREIAEQNKAVMLREKPEVRIQTVPIDLPNPIDFDLVYPVMLDATQKILENTGVKDAEKIINITSGTPTMTTCWVLLHKSGLIPNSRLVQSFESKYARAHGKTTQEVNLEIDDFPQITAPKELKRRLTIATREKEKLREQLDLVELDRRIPEIIGQSQPIREIKEQILKDIDAETHVLILGERGTGKQVIADAIWRLYHRENDSVLTIYDCGALSETLVISELFGHTKGAFTGANQERTGLLQQCNNRMLFLDEIGNLPIAGQQALLRFVTEGEVRPLGANTVQRIKTQIIAATNKNIHDSSLFAQDLKDRFDEIIELPPLRSRREDIPLLLDHFLPIYAKKQNTCSPLTLHKEVIQKLQEYDWPGNVRELEKWIQKLCKRFGGGELRLKDLPPRLIASIMREEDTDFELPSLPLSVPLKVYIEKIREQARKQAGGNMAEVDRLLGQTPGTEKQRQYRRTRR